MYTEGVKIVSYFIPFKMWKRAWVIVVPVGASVQKLLFNYIDLKVRNQNFHI